MTLHYEDGGLRLFHGSNKVVMPTFPDASYDSIITDPPYELGFMGKGWDSTGIAYDVDVWRECYRLLKPGGYLLAFGGTRTWHRIAVAIEDAGFEIRDSLAWLYSQGFPKSLNVSTDQRFCQCSKGGARSGSEAGIDALEQVSAADVPGLFDAVSPTAVETSRRTSTDVLAAVSGETGRGSAASDRPARTRRVDRLIGDQLHGEDERRGEPGVARRGDVQAPTGELRAPADGAMPSRVRVDDASERVRATASAGDGAMDRPSADTVGVREPQGSRHLEQRPVEPRALPDEPGSQARRGWPVCGGCGKPQVAGWGTALKPAFEPIVVARKPLAGTVAANVLAHGTGALNIDACRVPSDGSHMVKGTVTKRSTVAGDNREGKALGMYGAGASFTPTNHEGGRFPANVLLDESQAAELDRQAPDTGGAGKASGPTLTGASTSVARGKFNGVEDSPFYGDKGGASRFFPTFRYVAKAPGSERPQVDGVAHATVKPLDLMRWLVRLVTRPGGHVLDLFAGSGTTGEAALLEGMTVDLIELESVHLPLILQRVRKPLQPSIFGDWEGDVA